MSGLEVILDCYILTYSKNHNKVSYAGEEKLLNLVQAMTTPQWSPHGVYIKRLIRELYALTL